MEINVYYEDTDCGGVVYYANYLKYFERIRTPYLADRGIDLAGYMKNGIIFTVATADIKYRSPGRYGDTLVGGMKVEKVRGSSFLLSYTINRKSDGKLLVTGSTKMACIDDSEKMKPALLPNEIRLVLEDGKREEEKREDG
ncbi:MAG: YbgC/FadM family acyl-CoA thioesterase [Nitrospinota bacterium]